MFVLASVIVTLLQHKHITELLFFANTGNKFHLLHEHEKAKKNCMSFFEVYEEGEY